MNIFQVYYSENLADDVDIGSVLALIHDAAHETGEITLSTLRTLAMPVQNYLIADRDPENMFMHVVARIKRRDPEVVKKIESAVFGALNSFFETYFADRLLEISLEFVDINPVRKGNLQEKVRRETRRRARAASSSF